jgi:hypothetical protein
MADIALVPAAGSITATVFENANIGIPPTLFFEIEIPLRPFTYHGECQDTSVRLDFIDFGVGDWRDLAGREFRFPVNPEPGYIDGSIHLGNAHNPADTTRIAFGALAEGNTLSATLDITFDFTQEGNDDLGIISVTWEGVELAFDPAQLDAVCADARRIIKPRSRRGRVWRRDL